MAGESGEIQRSNKLMEERSNKPIEERSNKLVEEDEIDEEDDDTPATS